MRVKQTMTMLLLAGAVVLTSVGCTKKGDIGPKGDKGDKGEQGPQGGSGAGFEGVSVHTYDVNFEGNITHRNIPLLSGTSSDIILVYMDISSDGTGMWQLLPVKWSGTRWVEYSIKQITGGVASVSIEWYENNFTPWSPNSTYKFRVMVIPTSAIQAQPDVNLNDYQAVKQAFLDNDNNKG